MKPRKCAGAICAALALAACAGQSPHLSYSDYLPNTNEDPAWARNTNPPAVPDRATPPRSPAPAR